MNRLKMFCLSLVALLAITGAFAEESVNRSSATNTSAPASFQVRNQKYGELLRPEDANSADGTRIVLYPGQPWKCMTWKFHPAGESAFRLQNHFTSKTFAPDTKAAQPQPPVTQVPFAKGGAECPVWQFTKLADGTYKVTDAKSGKALTAVKENGSGVTVVLQAWQEKEEQKWELLPIDPKQLTM